MSKRLCRPHSLLGFVGVSAQVFACSCGLHSPQDDTLTACCFIFSLGVCGLVSQQSSSAPVNCSLQGSTLAAGQGVFLSPLTAGIGSFLHGLLSSTNRPCLKTALKVSPVLAPRTQIKQCNARSVPSTRRWPCAAVLETAALSHEPQRKQSVSPAFGGLARCLPPATGGAIELAMLNYRLG